MTRILIAEDDELTLELLEKVLRREGYEVLGVADGQAAIDALRKNTFDLVLTDVQMARASGMEVLDEVLKRTPDLPVVLITAYAEPGAVMDAIHRGASDYLGKPIDVDAVRSTVSRTLERVQQRGNASPGQKALDDRALIGTSAKMLALYKEVARVAPTDATVLIIGESGVGKELVARTIHARSRRQKMPFVAVNCAALAEGVLESELFGHERGAFTGAQAGRRGLFEEASGGTLFLDEVGDVSTKMQGQLLRALQEGEIRRVGGNTSIPVDVRIIAATNRDLTEDVRRGRMRQDLFFRLNVVRLDVPPLRERRDDLEALVEHLVARSAEKAGVAVPGVSIACRERLRGYDWPGNVRELENALARAVAMAQGGVIVPGDLPPHVVGQSGPPRGTIDEDWPTLEELDRRYIDRVLLRTGGNKTSAAAVLGVDRRTLQRLFASNRALEEKGEPR
ncbi:MAG: sigma-54 dependent transcriptional regulator [Polyangia bacterium]